MKSCIFKRYISVTLKFAKLIKTIIIIIKNLADLLG